MLTGRHLIAGEWVAARTTFKAVAPATGQPFEPDFWEGDPDTVMRAAIAADRVFPDYRMRPAGERAEFLRTIAAKIESRREALVERGQIETALPEERLTLECGRTTAQLRMFADLIEDGGYLGPRIDHALPGRRPLPRPDIRMTRVPIGPVAVFGASNFPLAFSVAGGDTAAALAAGCPVIFKGHPAHPGVSEIVASAIQDAVNACAMPDGVFSLIHGASHDVGQALVRHELVRAVCFTGSLRGGRALFDIAVSRREPIPFFGELGSVNPVFILPGALAARGQALGEAWAASLTLGVGQFCTNPGLVVGCAGPAFDTFVEAAHGAASETEPQTMLTPAIASSYRKALDALGVGGGQEDSAAGPCSVVPAIIRCSAEHFLSDTSLHNEIFGPAGIAVGCRTGAELMDVARALEGQLTATIQMEESDTDLARELTPVLVQTAGRLIRNGFPTGVEVCDAIVHGGPYPASTDARTTSVGTLAIERFLRPVAFQDFPESLLPLELHDHPRALAGA